MYTSIRGDGDEELFGTLAVNRFLSSFGIPNHLSSSVNSSSDRFLENVIATAAECGGDFRTSPFTELVKPLESRPALMIRTILSSVDARFREFRVAVLEVIDDISGSDSVNVGSIKILQGACESNLYSLRYLATFTVVLAIHSLGPISNPTTDRFFGILSLRTQDTCPKIRQFAGIVGMLETYFAHQSISVTNDRFVETICNMCRDPSYLVRASILKYLQDTVSKNRELVELIRPMSRKIGDEVYARCFDSASSTVAILAVRLLSDPVFGEILLGGDEDKYQCLSLLVWQLSPSEKQVNLVAKEALRFVNNHILATPGILSDRVTGSQKLLMMAEFIEQYSDGLVYPLTGRFILAYSANMSCGVKNSLLRGETFETVLESLVDEVRDSVVRKGTLSSIFAGVSKDDNKSNDAALKLRINTVLEILYNVSVIFGTTELISSRQLRMMSHLFDCWDEADEPCYSLECPTSESQAEIREKAFEHGIRARRFSFEIIYGLIQIRFPEQSLSALDGNLDTESSSRRHMFRLVRDAIESILAS